MLCIYPYHERRCQRAGDKTTGESSVRGRAARTHLPRHRNAAGQPPQIEKAERLISVSRGGANLYQLRNRSAKPIRSFTVSYTFDGGPGGSWGWEGGTTGELIMPGQCVPSARDSDYEIISLTEELRDKLKLRGPMRGVVIYMVERVEFADGSIYSDEATAKALRQYLDDLSFKAERGSQLK